MDEKRIEDFIGEVLSRNAQEHALAFVSHLRASGMVITRFTYHGEDTLHWQIKFQGENAGYILLDAENAGWTVMPVNSIKARFANYEADDAMKETAWSNLNICNDGKCGGCSAGTGARRKIFGKEIDNVCPMAYNFTNPDSTALKLVIEMMGVRKSDLAKDAE